MREHWERLRGLRNVMARDPGRIVTSVRVTLLDLHHARVDVWNRGGLAGSLTVIAADARTIACRLVGETREEETNVDGFTLWAANYTSEWK